MIHKVFRKFGLDLSSKTDIEKVSMYDTYKESTMGRVKFVKLDDSEWILMGDQVEADSDQDEHINDMEGGSQPIGDLDIPPLQIDAPEAELVDIPHVEVSATVDESPLFEVRA